MNRVPQADWAATVPAEGVIGLSPWAKPGGVIRINPDQINPGGANNNDVLSWNDSTGKYEPRKISSSQSTQINEVDDPGFAVRKKPNGAPFGLSVNNWARWILNVKLYGAVGNGVDDSGAVNSAIAQLNTSGFGVVYFPAGNYFIGDALNYINAPFVIMGDGHASSKISFSGLYGFRAFLESSQYGEFRNISIYDCQTAIELTGGNVRINDSRISASGKCVSFSEKVLGGHFNCTDFLSSGTGSYGIYGPADFVSVKDCIFDAESAVFTNAVKITSGTACSFDEVVVIGCTDSAFHFGTATEDFKVSNLTAKRIAGTSIIHDEGSGNFVFGIQGIGSNTDNRFEDRKEIVGSFTLNPPSIASMTSFRHEFSVPGARLGDRVLVSPPYSIGLISHSSYVDRSDVCALVLFNTDSSAIDLSSGQWKYSINN